MSKNGTFRKRIDRLSDANRPSMRVFFADAKTGSPGIIPDDFEPERDMVFLTSYLDRDGVNRSEFFWRGKPYDRTEV